MGLLPSNCESIELSSPLHTLQWRNSIFNGKRLQWIGLPNFSRDGLRVSASQKSMKKMRKWKSENAMQIDKDMPDGPTNVSARMQDDASATQVDAVFSIENEASSRLENIPSRESVLQACVVTSSLIAALGVTIRQVSHIASVEGLPIFDCSIEPSFSFEIWHLELIAGLVVLVSSCRYLLLKSWPEFEESSQVGNQQVLTSLEPIDYMLVAFLPGFCEELLFRGALLPLLGYNPLSALAVGTLFGILHLGNGRKYSFSIWATFVGFVYGYATIVSSSIVVPMAAHGLNNLVGALLWRFSKSDQSE